MRRIANVHDGEFRVTPNQNLIIANVAKDKRKEIEDLVAEHRHAAPVDRVAPQFDGLRRAADLRLGARRKRALSARA